MTVKIFAIAAAAIPRSKPKDLETVTELLKSTLKLPLHHRKYPELDNKIQSCPSHRRDPTFIRFEFRVARVVDTLNAMADRTLRSFVYCGACVSPLRETCETERLI